MEKKITSILDSEDIVRRQEHKPPLVAPLTIDRAVINREEVAESTAAIKDFTKRKKKATSMITQTIDENLVMNLDICDRDPCLLRENFAAYFNRTTPAQLPPVLSF